uniref:Dynein light chain, flagellar outer arm n=1 Tax=Schistocephalus solidus TaxID=70667 RepID=A0A0X3NT97_SCHSO
MFLMRRTHFSTHSTDNFQCLFGRLATTPNNINYLLSDLFPANSAQITCKRGSFSDILLFYFCKLPNIFEIFFLIASLTMISSLKARANPISQNEKSVYFENCIINAAVNIELFIHITTRIIPT